MNSVRPSRFAAFLLLGLVSTPLFLSSILAQEAAPTAPTPAPAPAAAKSNNVVVLKLDDLTSKSPQWVRVLEYLKGKNIKCGAGIICKSLDTDKQAYFDWIKEVQAGGLVEFWNHGYDHAQWKEGTADVMEFKGPSLEQQKDHFTKSQALAKSKLGITFHTFGAPFNATDANTREALSSDPDLKLFLYGKPEDAAAMPNVMIIERTQMNIENPTFLPNPERVEHDYKVLHDKVECFVIQGHPNNWTDERFEKFKTLVEYLQAQGVTFMTPYEYYLTKHPAK